MKINLLGGDSRNRSSISSIQRRLNMYNEGVAKSLGEPGMSTHLPTPGLTLLGSTPNGLPIRGMYRASNGDLYVVAGFQVYYVAPTWQFFLVGNMTTTSTLNPTKMADNGTNIILCDGTSNGYSIVMATRNVLLPLTSSGWFGSTNVDFSDTFFLANKINTPTFYISNAEDIIFDPVQFAGKTAKPDFLVSAVEQHRVIWLIGTVNTEVWYNSGAVIAFGEAFPFSIMPGVAIDWGCAAPYSIAKAETAVFWLAQNINGEAVVLKGSGYNVSRISTHAIEYQFSTYAALGATLSDCVAYCYMQNGHSFYVMNFPAADVTWVYDLSTEEWSERCFLDSQGIEHRHLSTCHAFAYASNLVNDHRNGNLYVLDLNAYTDNGAPIKREIIFPRMVDVENDNRVLYRSFVAEISCGESAFPNDDPMVTLSWSDDKGKTWGNGVLSSVGQTGEYGTFFQVNRLGMARNRNFRIGWAANALVALQSAYVDVEVSGA